MNVCSGLILTSLAMVALPLGTMWLAMARFGLSDTTAAIAAACVAQGIAFVYVYGAWRGNNADMEEAQAARASKEAGSKKRK